MPTEKRYAAKDNNKVRTLAELFVSEGQGTTTDTVIVLAELRCGIGRIAYDKFTARFGATQGVLSIDIIGGRVRPNTRLGENRRPHEEVQKVAGKRTEIRSGSVGAQAGLTVRASLAGPRAHASVGVGGQSGASVKETRDTKITETNVSRRVEAQAGERWAIRELETGTVLEGLYLGNQELCVVEAEQGSFSLRARFSVARRDFKIIEITNNKTGGKAILSKNKQKIISILAAKSIYNDGDEIIFCESTMSERSNERY